MKSIIKNLFALLAVVMMLSSCNSDSGNVTYFAYATVKGSQMSYYLKADEGVPLNIVKNNVPAFEVTNNMRVILFFNKLEDTPSSSSATPAPWNIEILTMYKVMTKNPIYASTLDTPAKNDSIGHDPINMAHLWSTEGHLNVLFEIYGVDSKVDPLVSLVVDDEKSTASDIYAELRHNAKSTPIGERTDGNISFYSDNFLNQGQDSVRVHVGYKSYGGEVKSLSATVKRVYDASGYSAPKISNSPAFVH